MIKKIWITTDTHYNHRAMEKYCDRPSNFEAEITKHLINLVRDNDILIHLGDVCIGKDEAMHEMYIKPIKGIKILVKGNHDRKSNQWYLDHGWDFVCESFVDTYFGKKILFSHAPKKDTGFDINIHGHFHNTLHRLLECKYVVDGEEERNKEDLAVLTDKHKLVALEHTDYKPVLLENIINNL